MLVLSRKRDESIVIGDNIVITIIEVRGDKVRLGITADEQRKQKIDELRQKGEESQRTTLEKINQILDTDQAARFKQIRLQRDGVRAIAQADIADELTLTPAQRSKVKKFWVL